MRYLKEGYIDPNTTAPGLQKAREKLRVLSMTDQERWEYEQFLSDKWYERDVIDYAETQAWNKAWDKGYDVGEADGMANGMAKGIAKGMSEGIAKGKSEAIQEMIKKMIAEGLDEETISRITGYPHL